jgi:2-polyprenyl-3-methyl-5-hydroxy-6-metoxy-1,4-benzoquinol methylase
MRTNPQPTLDTMGAAYPDGYTLHREELRPAGAPAGLVRWALVNLRGYPLGRRDPALLRWLKWPWAALRLRNRRNVGYIAYEGEGRVLDYGCSIGKYVAQMAAAGWKAEGMDLVPDAVATGRAAGLNLRVGTLPGTAVEPGQYDLVTMWHVLEHVPSPKATLEAIRGILKPRGRVALVCPLSDSLAARWTGAAWYGLDVPRHLTHFTRPTLRRHLEAAGFTVERVQCIRRPTFFTRSYTYMAEDTGRPLHRWLGRSHVMSRLASHLALATGRTDEILFIARRG